jgi:hypothetical protein
MRVVRIFGASYSGSTALGYVLNTAEGYFFGSETYRLLLAFQERQKRLTGRYRFPTCDMCGADCPRWSRALMRELRSDRVERLEQVYAAFARRNPEVAVYVDGSKHLRVYDLAVAGQNLVSVKHPLRMVASSTYNDRRQIGFSSTEFGELRQEISENRAVFLDYARAYLGKLSKIYAQILESLPDSHVCRMDAMHENDMEGFGVLAAHLGLEGLDPTDFARFPVHTLGGNRAPLWKAQERQQGKTVDHPRRKYYETARSIGDWSIDDKHALIFTDAVRAEIMALGPYRRACALLGYDRDAPLAGAPD